MVNRFRLVSRTLIALSSFALMSPSAFAGWAWTVYNGHSYALTNSFGNWTQSESEAVAAGGHLATVNDYNETMWLADFIKDCYPRGAINKPFNSNIAWIGYNLLDSNWVWVSGESSSYTNYSPLWSWDGNEPYTYLHGVNTEVPGTWRHDIQHNDMYWMQPRGIIEVAGIVPEPSSLVLMSLGMIGIGYGWHRKRRSNRVS